MCFSLQISNLNIIISQSSKIPESQTAVTKYNSYFTYSLALRPSESLGLLYDRCPFSFAHCHNITLTWMIPVFCLHSMWFSYDAQNKRLLFFKWHRSVGLCEERGVCFLWSKNVHSFYFNHQCTKYFFFYFNNIYIIITATCLDTFVSSSGSSKVVRR